MQQIVTCIYLLFRAGRSVHLCRNLGAAQSQIHFSGLGHNNATFFNGSENKENLSSKPCLYSWGKILSVRYMKSQIITQYSVQHKN